MDLTVHIINADDKHISNALGINDNTCERIGKKIMHELIDKTEITDVMHEVSKICNHPNELMYAGFLIAKLSSPKANPFGALSDLFGK